MGAENQVWEMTGRKSRITQRHIQVTAHAVPTALYRSQTIRGANFSVTELRSRRAAKVLLLKILNFLLWQHEDRNLRAVRMSLYGSFLSDEQFLCSICLDVFTNPSSTPCGHSFCMSCISRYWDGSKVCQCPLCNKTFQKRPDLQINRTLREITEQFRSMKGGDVVGRDKREGRGGGGGGGVGGGGHRGIPDNVFDELKKRLPRSLPKAAVTLTCEAQVKKEPSKQLTRIYCLTDRECICPECVTVDHQGHQTVTIEDAWIETKAQLTVSGQEIQEMIRQRIRKMEEIKMSVTQLELAVERETASSVCLFSELASAIERSQVELMEVMDRSRRAAEQQADAMIRQLELEVEELRRRESTIAELVQSDDHIHCVKVFLLQYRNPVQSKHSQVRCGDRHQQVPDNPERFDRVVCVLGREAISSGRHYWEVEVGGKTDWDLGVARQSINRKGKIEITPSNGYWFLSLRDKNKYAFRTEPSTDVHLNLRPHKIGIFVDFEKGQVSFYNVDAKIHIYTFNDTFNECIYPFFSPCTNKSGKNEGPLTISPVNMMPETCTIETAPTVDLKTSSSTINWFKSSEKARRHNVDIMEDRYHSLVWKLAMKPYVVNFDCWKVDFGTSRVDQTRPGDKLSLNRLPAS
ncbi:E3 ubiquitin-protein ligase TRIM39 [Collichthys lucidus]|uniref:E3 ubiquitin-protein ligase TRIM39 n=1 Tax=Collichthys lucidus TaxID=240159 RepID=A0A4U5VW30_COLLU|nr:E3 ubiquitin-protein ligase TRIM39 [Collichthys lucidus]